MGPSVVVQEVTRNLAEGDGGASLTWLAAHSAGSPFLHCSDALNGNAVTVRPSPLCLAAAASFCVACCSRALLPARRPHVCLLARLRARQLQAHARENARQHTSIYLVLCLSQFLLTIINLINHCDCIISFFNFLFYIIL